MSLISTVFRRAKKQTIKQRYAIKFCAKLDNKASDCRMEHPCVSPKKKAKDEQVQSVNNAGFHFQCKRCGPQVFKHPGQTVNIAYYVDVLETLRKRSSVSEIRSPLPGCSVMTMLPVTPLYALFHEFLAKCNLAKLS